MNWAIVECRCTQYCFLLDLDHVEGSCSFLKLRLKNDVTIGGRELGMVERKKCFPILNFPGIKQKEIRPARG